MLNHSFAVMAYEDSPYLPQCLESLINQENRSIIYIATSTPSEYIRKIAAQYSVELYITETNKGIGNDWNFGLKQAQTKYVTLAHQDDIYSKEYSTKCVEAAERNQDAIICFTDYQEIAAEHVRERNLLLKIKEALLFMHMPVYKSLTSNVRKRLFLALGSPICCPSVMYNMDLLRDFSFSSEFVVNLDWDAWYRMSQMRGRFVYIAQTLMHHRVHLCSATTQGISSARRKTEDLRMFKHFWPAFLARWISRVYARSYKFNEV
jgi:glycosyltransferase involved in cell wall biosynthesis